MARSTCSARPAPGAVGEGPCRATDGPHRALQRPSVKAAFDAEGRPTKAAEGFARGKGVPVESLERVEDEGGAYVYAVVEEHGGHARDVLPGLLASLAEGIEWPKSMRWGSGDARFSRPIRWLLALFGDEVVPVQFAGPDRVSHHLRPPLPRPRTRRGSGGGRLRDRAARGVRRTAAEPACGADRCGHQRAHERGRRCRGRPREDVRRGREPRRVADRRRRAPSTKGSSRYLARSSRTPWRATSATSRVRVTDGALLNRFVVVHNGDPERTEAIVAGHERVLRARLADAAFFYREDLAVPVESYVERLDSIVFQEKLGTLARQGRARGALTVALGELAAAPADEAAYAARAAQLAKADLVSNVGDRVPVAAGRHGRLLRAGRRRGRRMSRARSSTTTVRVSRATTLPATLAGRLVAMADKLDTICGIFARRSGAHRLRRPLRACAAGRSASSR